MTITAFHLFQAYGVELEYMIVDKDSLQVKPISDELLKHEIGSYGNEVHNGIVTWTNERVLHLIELKSGKLEINYNTLEHAFADNIKLINKILSQWNAVLMPTAAHPFMNPSLEAKVWPHQKHEVYELYDQLFDFKKHGLSNLQSTKLNLPFYGDAEFGKLHAAIRVLLPLLPALCASSPLIEGKPSGYLDARLSYYKTNQSRIPSLTGQIIPEPVFSKKNYEEAIYERIQKDIAVFNTEKILDPIRVNSRGVIPHFDKGYIELRIMDIQECPAADFAIIALVTEATEALVNEQFASLEDQKEVLTDVLAGILDETIQQGQAAEIYSTEYSSLFGINNFTTPKQIWLHIYQTLIRNGNTLLEKWEPQLSIILNEGTLSDRILKSLKGNFSEPAIKKVYRQLSDCLAQNKMFIP